MDDNLYAIYSYKFREKNEEGDWTQGNQVTEPDMSITQDKLFNLFGATGEDFLVQKEVSDGAKKYTCKVYGNDHRVVALRLQNEKEEHYWHDVEDPKDPMGNVVKESIQSKPPTIVIIDCRPGYNTIAIKVEKDAWRNTDNVRDLMEESFNRYFGSQSIGFRIELFTKMYDRDFFDYSRYRIKKEGRTLKSMTINFRTGGLNPKIETMVKSTAFLKQLFQVIDKYGLSGSLKFDKPFSEKLIDRRRHDIETIIALIASDPNGYALDVTFDDNMTLHCGKDTRAELPMEPPGALELFHHRTKADGKKELEIEFIGSPISDVNKYLLEGWLDDVAERTKKMKDAKTINRRGNRKNKK